MAQSGEFAGNDAEARVDSLTQGEQVRVPADSFITNAEFLRDGQDLILRHPDGEIFTIENYFSAMPPPTLVNDAGAGLSPAMIRAFVQPAQDAQRYAQAGMQENDESAIGLVTESKGAATVTRTDGTVENIVQGIAIYEGDIVETDAEGAVNIVFIDETSFAVSNNARLAIDEYIFDPASGSGTQSFSVLRGMFVFVSGMIGREDPDDVEINTPIGNIGIRGTTIAGNVDSGEITVIEGAIVLRALDGRTETTLATQFETARFNPGGTIDHLGVQDSSAIAAKFSTMQEVASSFFAGIGSGQPAPTSPTPAETAPQQESPADTGPEIVPPGGYDETSFDGGQNAGFGQAATNGDPGPGGAEQNMPPIAPVTPAPVGTDNSGTGTTLDGSMINNNLAPPLAEPVIATPPTAPPTVTPPGPTPPTNPDITITDVGNYTGTSGDDNFITEIADFGMIMGGTGYDRLVFNAPGIGPTPYNIMAIYQSNLDSIEEINAVNGIWDILDIHYTYELTAQNLNNHMLIRFEDIDDITIYLEESGFRLTDIGSDYATVSDGTHIIEFNSTDLFKGKFSGLDLLLPNATLANGLIFRSYGENGLMSFEDSTGATIQYNGPGFHNVVIGEASADNRYFYANSGDYYFDLRDGDDSLIVQNTEISGSYFDGGAGYDRFQFDIAGNLDLSALGTERFHNFEEIRFQSTQTIRISIDQIFQLMEQSEQSNSLYISDSGNTAPKALEITGGDIAALADTIETVGIYNEYSFDIGGTIHTLLVSQNVDVVTV